MDRGAWWDTVHEVARVRHDLVTKPPPPVFFYVCRGFPGSSARNESICNVGDLGLIPRLGQPPGGQHGNPLQHSYLEIPQGQSNLQSIIHGVAKSRT